MFMDMCVEYIYITSTVGYRILFYVIVWYGRLVSMRFCPPPVETTLSKLVANELYHSAWGHRGLQYPHPESPIPLKNGIYLKR